MKTFFVEDRGIGQDHPPFVIAEMSGNHNQSLDRALAIVDAAAEAGADALKLQTYTPDTMTLDISDGPFRIDDPNSLWTGRSLYELYGEAQTPWEWHKPIFDRCRERGLIGFSSPFDTSAVDFLEELEVPLYKLASFENTDVTLIRRMGQTKKPLIASTGMASLSDLAMLVDTAREAGCPHLVLLKCTSAYPAPATSCNVRTIPHLAEAFGLQAGLSDHTPGIGVPLAAIALGATVVEKHFTLARADGGVDSAFSLEPSELTSLVKESKRAWESLGGVRYGTSKVEEGSISFKRSLWICKDIKAGEPLTPDNTRAIRPGHGISAKYYDIVMGQTVPQDTRRGTPLRWETLKRP